MKEIRVMSRDEIEQYYFIQETIISITSNSKNADIINSGGDTLFLKFDDVEKGEEKCITRSQAKLITNFIKEHRHNDRFIISCDGGVSRSAAVAAAILKYFYNDDSQIFDNRKYCPNMTVYRMVLDSFMGGEN